MINAFAIIDIVVNQIPKHSFLMFEIGMMIILAGVIAFVLKLFKQPLIPSYIIAGIILGPLVVNLIQNTEVIFVLSEIGVAFLLFFAGMEMNIKKLKEVGKTSAIVAVVEILLLFLAGFGIALWAGFTGQAPIYVGLVVAFSSTMIVLKLLADKRELSSLHGRIVIGILLVQDIVAIAALTILTTDFTVVSIGFALIKALIFVVIAFVLAKVVNPIFRIAAKNMELLLLTSISLLFLFAIGSYIAGLSLIIGAFFAGVALASSDYRTEIQGKIMPLRDFFAVIFFVALGMQLSLINMQFFILLLILLALVMLFKPLVLMFATRFVGYSKRTSFLTGNSLAQTSEFSLIIATLGLGLGHLGTGAQGQGLFSTLILLTIISMATTTYCIKYDKRFFQLFSWPLNMAKGIHQKKEVLEFISPKKKKIIIFGAHRMGSLFLKYLKSRKDEVLIIDHNPEIIRSLIVKKISCIYGDFVNPEVLEKVNLKEAEMIISTIPDVDDSAYLIKQIRARNKNVIIFVTANVIDDAEDLYGAGADYVMLPQVITGEHGFNLAKKILKDKKKMRFIKSEQLKHLKEIHHLLYEKK